MSQPPEYPGKKRLVRMTARSGGGAYEGAAEAVGAILVATLLGYGIDQYFETEPIGLLIGAVFGFAAFVVRLMRLGKELYGDELNFGGESNENNSAGTNSQSASSARSSSLESDNENELAAGTAGDHSGPAEEPGLSSVSTVLGVFDEDDKNQKDTRKDTR